MKFDTHTLKLYYPEILESVANTFWITLASLFFGAVFGLLACLFKMSNDKILSKLSSGFIDFFRTIPEMVLIFWVYSCLPLLFSLRISAEICGLISLSLMSTAYLAEIFRAGILSVPKGEIQAANSLAIPKISIWRWIIIPQAIRRMLPPFINFFTELLKATSLLSAIGVTEMAYKASVLGAKTLAYLEFFSLIAILYFIIIYPLSLFSKFCEIYILRKTGQ